jgi:hypothetical protein
MKNDLTSLFLDAQRARAIRNPELLARATAIQTPFIKDTAALITYLAGRRHGKTDGFAVRMATYARPGALQAYVAPTITRAHEILEPVLRTLEREAGLRFTIKGDTVTFPNGGQVRMMGMSNVAEIQKLRGEDLLAAYFDECGVPKSDLLKTAVLECAWEALRKFRGQPGSGAVLGGTPGPLPEGFYWEASTQQDKETGRNMYGASRHYGTIFDNPIFGGGKAERSIEEDLENRLYVSKEDSKYRREVLAHWCLPSELRCYGHYDGALRPAASAPTQGRTIMAVDLGWHDHTAIVILRLTQFEECHPQPDGAVKVVRGERIHVLHALKRQHWHLPELADKLRELQSVYSVGTIVGDTGGGASKQVVESFASMFGISMLGAQKGALGLKRSRIHTINDMFGIDRIWLYEDAQPLAAELGCLVWNEERADHDERQGDNAADAFGYGVIETYVPVTVERVASQAEADRQAREAQKRRMLRR